MEFDSDLKPPGLAPFDGLGVSHGLFFGAPPGLSIPSGAQLLPPGLTPPFLPPYISALSPSISAESGCPYFPPGLDVPPGLNVSSAGIICILVYTYISILLL